MEDKFPKSKLKRKKSAFDERQTEIAHRGTMQNVSIALNSRDITKDTDSFNFTSGSVHPTVAWWKRKDLISSESLWAITVQQYLDSEAWGPVPELPKPSTVSPGVCRTSQWQSPDHINEVPPFPEPSHPPESPPPVADSLSVDPPERLTKPAPLVDSLVTSSHDRGLPTENAGNRLDAPLSAGRLATAADSDWTATQELVQRRRDIEGTAWRQGITETSDKVPGTLSFVAEKARETRMEEEKEEMKEMMMRRRMMMMEDEEVVEAGPSGVVRRDDGAGGGGGERLQCCPMCLTVFPVRFSQMDCDSHLAQCLSDMNVDMTW